MTFLEHLDELRKRILHSVMGVVVSFCICWTLREEIFHFLAVPIADVVGGVDKLIFIKPNEMLPERQRSDSGLEPPLILASWWPTPIILKRDRLAVHIVYASEHGVLEEVDHFLRSLPESDWAHVKNFSTR